MAQYIRIANRVAVDGDVIGSFNKGDILYSEMNKNEKYEVKGFTFIKKVEI